MAEGHVVGIDLGTTNSLVAYMQGDAPVVIPGVDGANLVPSVVALDPIPAEGGRPTVTVGNSARRALIETPERVIYSVKRLMGRGLEEVQSELNLFPFRLADDVEAGEVPRIQLGELRFTPPEISAYILRQLTDLTVPTWAPSRFTILAAVRLISPFSNCATASLRCSQPTAIHTLAA